MVFVPKKKIERGREGWESVNIDFQVGEQSAARVVVSLTYKLLNSDSIKRTEVGTECLRYVFIL